MLGGTRARGSSLVLGGGPSAAWVVAALLASLSGCALDADGRSAGIPDVGSDPSLPVPDAGDGAVEPDPFPSCAPDDDLGSAVGSAVVTGTTEGAGDDMTPYCTYGSSAPDRTYRWTAPERAIYSIDTLGSDFDTVLQVLRANCDGRPLACNDEVRPGKKGSLVRVDLELAERVLIVVDGYRKASGNFILNITEEAAVSESTACDDDLDNDRDGDTDCADFECRDDAACVTP